MACEGSTATAEGKQNNYVVCQNSNVNSSSRCLKTQVCITLVVGMSYMSCGMSLGHSAVLLPEIQSNKSDIHIDEKSASLIASVYTIVSPLGCLLSGITMEIWGRRVNNFISSIGMVLGWILLSTSSSASMMIWSRGIEGFFRAAIMTSTSVHFDEIADPRLRGNIFVLCALILSIGIMVMSSIGAIVHWRIGCWISTSLTALSMLLLPLLYESPSWLLRKNQVESAEQTLKWIWGDGLEREAMEELESMKMRYLKSPENTSVSPFNIKHLPQNIRKQTADLLKPYIFKPFILMHIFSTFQVICGHSLLTYYTVDVLTMMKSPHASHIDGYVTNVVVSSVRVISIVLLFFAMLRMGRRKITMISGIASTSSITLLSIVLYLQGSIPPQIGEWIAVSLFIIYVTSYCFGFYILPTLMLGETQSAKVRSLVYGYVFTVNDLLVGTLVRYFSSILNILHLEGLFLIFGAACLFCTVFAYLFLPETQGKSLEEIEDYFKKPKIVYIRRK